MAMSVSNRWGPAHKDFDYVQETPQIDDVFCIKTLTMFAILDTSNSERLGILTDGDRLMSS